MNTLELIDESFHRTVGHRRTYGSARLPIAAIHLCTETAVRSVGIAVFLTKIEEKPRLRTTAQHLVHYFERIVIGIVSLYGSAGREKESLDRARSIHKGNLRGLRSHSFGQSERSLGCAHPSLKMRSYQHAHVGC